MINNEESKITEYKPWITEKILRKRLLNEQSGSNAKQLLVTIAICFGSFSFGNIISWGGPGFEHIKTLEMDVQSPNRDFIWIVSIAPMASACGILVWAFLSSRIGPKMTILIQTPFMLLSWFLKGYCDTFKIYCSAHFLSGFCASSYLFAGDILLIQSTHRKYVKTYYAVFRSSIMLGVLAMNVISKFCDRVLLCIICACMPAICFIMIIFLPDSPVFLMKKGEYYTAKALKFYAGKKSYMKELNVIRQYVQLMNIAGDNNDMLYNKVVYKAICIAAGLQIFRTMTGFYAFVLDSVRIFATHYTSDPYVANLVFGIVVFFTRLVGTLIILHGNFGVKKPMMTSMSLMALILLTLGFAVHFEIEKVHKWLTLVLLCLFSVVYDIGMDIIPEIIVYEYMPYQIYDFVIKMMNIFHWIMVFAIVQIYMWSELEFGLKTTYWGLAGIAILGFIFISIFVIETKGKSLIQIQTELGCNPAGSRGSRRQRIPNPFEAKEEANYLQNINTTNELKRSLVEDV